MTTQGFPLANKGVACQLKWTWNTLRLSEATSACCHRVNPVEVTVENFQNIHNHPVWVKHRKMQLQGIFPQEGCDYCEKIEKAGGISERLMRSTQSNIYPPELDLDPNATTVSPRVLEVFLNNVCNLACVYCDESNSSRIQSENTKFGHLPVDNENKHIIPIVPQTKNYQDLLESFYVFLNDNYRDLRQLNVLGGEPFYQSEFFDLVDFICSKKNPDLCVSIVSNLMVKKTVIEKFISKIKPALAARRLKRVDITASIDCFGKEQEYIRYGISLKQWKENFEFLQQYPWLYLSINNTICSLSIEKMPDLLNYINKRRQIGKINHAFQLVTDKKHLHPDIFGAGYFNAHFQKILDLMPEDDEWNTKSKQYMAGISTYLDQCEEDLQQQHYLHLYLDEIDRRRNLDWKHVFPWLANHFGIC